MNIREDDLEPHKNIIIKNHHHRKISITKMKCEEKYLKNTSDDAVVTVVKRLSNHYNVGENREWRV